MWNPRIDIQIIHDSHFVSDPSRVLNISPLLSFSITHPVFKCFCGGLVIFFLFKLTSSFFTYSSSNLFVATSAVCKMLMLGWINIVIVDPTLRQPPLAPLAKRGQKTLSKSISFCAKHFLFLVFTEKGGKKLILFDELKLKKHRHDNVAKTL